jgi:hypothetical protein
VDQGLAPLQQVTNASITCKDLFGELTVKDETVQVFSSFEKVDP